MPLKSYTEQGYLLGTSILLWKEKLENSYEFQVPPHRRKSAVDLLSGVRTTQNTGPDLCMLRQCYDSCT